MRARLLVGALFGAISVSAQQTPVPPLPRLTSAIVEGTPVEMQLRWPIARGLAVRDSLDGSSRRIVLTVTGMRADGDVRRMVRRGNIAALRVAPRGDSALVAIIELTDLLPYRLTRTDAEVVLRFAGVGEQVAPQTVTLVPDVRVVTLADSIPKSRGPAARSAGATDLTADDAFGTADQRTRERLKEWEGVTSERVTASWDRTPLRDVLALIGRMTNRSVAPGTGIDSILVSGDYRNARWTDVLVSIARIYGLRLRVGAGDILTIESAAALVKGDESIPLETRVIQLGYAKVAEVVPVLEKNLSKRGTATGLTENRAVIITDIPDNLERALQLVRLLDRPDQSVRISYMVVSVDRAIARDLGVILDAADARVPGNALGGIPLPAAEQTGTSGSEAAVTGPMSGNPNYLNVVRDRVSSAMASPLPVTSSPTFRFLASTLAGNYSLVGLVQALETNRMARVVARQQGVVRQGREFKGSSAEETPLRVQAFTGTGASGGSGGGGSAGTGAVGSAAGSTGGTGAGGIPFNSVGLVSTGIKLNATPTIEPDSMVALDIKVERSTAVPSGLGDAGVQFLRNEYSTSLRARSGETIVLGGLRDRVEGEQTAGVPFLMKIPFIGKLFSSKSRSGTERELLILVTAVIE